MKKYYITGTGTDIGKTFITSCINKLLINKYNKNIYAIKPVISGFDKDNLPNDTSLILDSLNLKYDDSNIDDISPFRLNLPLSPDMAAEKENITLKYDDILDFCNKTLERIKSQHKDYMFIEGVGGVMSPICYGKTNLDLIADLDISVILVCGSYLGSISHSLTAIKALEENNITISSIVLSESEERDVDIDDVFKSLSNFTDYNIVVIRRDKEHKDMENINIIEEIL